MRKILIYICFIVLCCYIIHPQQSAQTPDVPLNKDAGRVVPLKKVAAAHDEHGLYIFKNPNNILAVDDGSFFLVDQDQVLKFGPDGKFIKIIVNWGEGPGEATYVNQLYRRGNELIINTGFMKKLSVFDFNGKLIGEHKEKKKKKENPGMFEFTESTYEILAHRKDKFFIALNQNFIAVKNKNSREDDFFLLSPLNEWQDTLFHIPIESVPVKVKGEQFRLEKRTLVHTCDSEYLYFVNTVGYEIKRYDIHNNRISATWSRSYTPVKLPASLKDKSNLGVTLMRGSRKSKTEKFSPPQPKFLDDIKQLFMVEGQLWVMTSTYDENKGILFDKYNHDGRYLDNFYIPFADIFNVYTLYPSEIEINGNRLIIKETDEESNYKIVIYEIIDKK